MLLPFTHLLRLYSVSILTNTAMTSATEIKKLAHDGTSSTSEKGVAEAHKTTVNDQKAQPKPGDEELYMQDGVKQIEAITSAWTFKALIITYILYATSFQYS